MEEKTFVLGINSLTSEIEQESTDLNSLSMQVFNSAVTALFELAKANKIGEVVITSSDDLDNPYYKASIAEKEEEEVEEEEPKFEGFNEEGNHVWESIGFTLYNGEDRNLNEFYDLEEYEKFRDFHLPKAQALGLKFFSECSDIPRSAVISETNGEISPLFFYVRALEATDYIEDLEDKGCDGGVCEELVDEYLAESFDNFCDYEANEDGAERLLTDVSNAFVYYSTDWEDLKYCKYENACDYYDNCDDELSDYVNWEDFYRDKFDNELREGTSSFWYF